MNKKLAMMVIIGILLCGCVSQQGRLAIMDLDFRKPAQIEASVKEKEAPYKDWTVISVPSAIIENEQVKTESLPIVWWEKLFELISKLECRLTLFQIEWADHKKFADKCK
jgi:hypothetical protein